MSDGECEGEEEYGEEGCVRLGEEGAATEGVGIGAEEAE